MIHTPEAEVANSTNLSLTVKWHHHTLLDHFIKKQLGKFIMLAKYKLIESIASINNKKKNPTHRHF